MVISNQVWRYQNYEIMYDRNRLCWFVSGVCFSDLGNDVYVLIKIKIKLINLKKEKFQFMNQV